MTDAFCRGDDGRAADCDRFALLIDAHAIEKDDGFVGSFFADGDGDRYRVLGAYWVLELYILFKKNGSWPGQNIAEQAGN